MLTINTQVLPYLNVCCNIACCLFLIIGRWAISMKINKPKLHRLSMLISMAFSTIFLVSYLYYHYKVGHVPYHGVGALRTIYFIILVPHIILAAVVLPLVFRTLYLAISKQKEKHMALAAWTFPIWLYVSVSGIIIFLMLYIF